MNTPEEEKLIAEFEIEKRDFILRFGKGFVLPVGWVKNFLLSTHRTAREEGRREGAREEGLDGMLNMVTGADYEMERVKEIVNNMPSPKHDETSDGVFCKCWCHPKQMVAGEGFIFVHNDLIDREELKIRLGLIKGDALIGK